MNYNPDGMVAFQQRRREELRNGSPPATAIRTGKVGSRGNTSHLFLKPGIYTPKATWEK